MLCALYPFQAYALVDRQVESYTYARNVSCFSCSGSGGLGPNAVIYNDSESIPAGSWCSLKSSGTLPHYCGSEEPHYAGFRAIRNTCIMIEGQDLLSARTLRPSASRLRHAHAVRMFSYRSETFLQGGKSSTRPAIRKSGCSTGYGRTELSN